MMELKNEYDLECYLIKKYRTKFGNNLFPLVRRIGGEIISPEIDLLNIERKGLNDFFITGYEFKFLDCKNADANYKRIYAGIGQALMYFQYGIDRCYLVVGLSKRLSPKTMAMVFSKCTTLSTLMKNLEILPSNPLNYLGFWVFLETQKKGLFNVVKVNGRFPDFPFANKMDTETNNFVQNRTDLITDRFRDSNRFRKKCGLSPRYRIRGL